MGPVAIADTSPGHHVLECLAIAGGGTGGHVYPAVAIAEAFHATHPTGQVTFVGTVAGSDQRIAEAHGMRFAAVAAGPYYGVGALGRVRMLERLVAGVVDARRLLATSAVQLVLGLGGFASAPTLLAARSLGLPTVIHEANATAGLANRLLGRMANAVLLGFATAAADFSPGRCRTTGIPVRRALFAPEAPPRTDASGRPFHVLVLGGSQGSTFLNARVPELLAVLRGLGLGIAVRHQTGAAVEVERVRAAYDRAQIPGAEVAPFLDDVGSAYRDADFAITCAGAGTLAELAASGLPALVVPFASAARDHQVANARAFADVTDVWWTTEPAWDTTALAPRIATLAGDATALHEAGARMRRAATPGAAMEIVAACDALVRAR